MEDLGGAQMELDDVNVEVFLLVLHNDYRPRSLTTLTGAGR